MNLSLAQQQAHDALSKMVKAHFEPKPTMNMGDGLDLSDHSPNLSEDQIASVGAPHVQEPSVDVSAADMAQPPDSAATAHHLSRGAVFGNLDEGGIGSQESIAALAPHDGQPFTVNGEVAKLATSGGLQKARPPVDFSAPLGYQSPRDTELAAAQDEAKRRRGIASIGQVISDYQERPSAFLSRMNGGGSGGTPTPAKSSIWKDYENEGGQAVEDLKARRAADSQLATSTERKDPNSATAKTYRSVLLKFAPDLADQLANATPEQMERIAPWLESYAKEMKAPPSHGDPLEQAKLDETVRHNKATEGLGSSKAAARAAGHAAPSIAKEADLSSVPEDIRAHVQRIGEGLDAMPVWSAKTARLVNAVAQVYPHLDSSQFGAYKDVRDKLSKSDEVVALNTAYSHISRAKGNIPENFDTQSINNIKRVLTTGAGANTLTPFETDVKIAADELAKAYGNNSEAGRATIERLLEPGQSKAQLAARFTEIEALLDGKLGSYQHQFDRAAPKGAAPFRVLSPENENRAPVDNREHKTLSNGKHASRSPGGQWEVDD